MRRRPMRVAAGRSFPTPTISFFATAAGNLCWTSWRKVRVTSPCSTSAFEPSAPRRQQSRDAVRVELQRFEPRAEQNDMTGTTMHAIVGKLERKRAAKAQQSLRVASEPRACALDGIVEKLQALRP